MGWKHIADIAQDGSSQIVVTLSDGREEVFNQQKDEQLGAFVFQSSDIETSTSDNNLEIGFLDEDGDWHATAFFQGKTYLYVRTR